MGASAGGVSVKTDTRNYELHKIVEDLIGPGYVQTDKYEDTRYPDKYYLVKSRDVITIYNTQFAEKFFKRQDTRDLQDFIAYFQHPELIFAHERYDSGGTYSYALICNGELKRQFRSVSYETKIDYGELEDVEKDWKNGEVTRLDLGDGDFEISIKNLKTGFECTEMNLPQVILEQLQFEKLGFDDDDTNITDRAFFVRTPTTINVAGHPLNDREQYKAASAGKQPKPWWKFW